MAARFLAPGLVLLILAALPQSAAAAPTWLRPASLSKAGNTPAELGVAVDAAGDAFTVWTRAGAVQSAERPAGKTWSAAQSVSGSCLDARAVDLAVSPGGRAVAVWECPKGGNTIVQAAVRPLHGGWSAPHDLSAPGHDAHLPQVAVDRAGDALAVWVRSNGTNVAVQAAERRANRDWGAAESVSGPGRDVDHPDVALNAAGSAVAVWQSSDGSTTVIQAATRSSAGAWSAPQTLSSGGFADSPHVGIGSAGDAVAVWSLHAAHVRTQAAVCSGGAWAPAQTLSSASDDALQPQVAVNQSASAVAAWTSFDGRTYVVQGASRSRAGAWSGVQDLSSRSPDLGTPQVALDPAGDAVALWRGLVSAHERIQAARRPAGRPWSAPKLLSPSTADADLPDVALDAAGNAAAIWQSGNGVTWTVQTAGLDAAGPVLSRLRISGPRIPGGRLSFAVAPFDVWSALRGRPHWSFGDGATATGRRVTHAYSSSGSYTVRIRQSDALGNVTTTTRRLVIAPPCVVPSVVGKSLAAAKAAIGRAHCRTGRITRAFSGSVRKGRVLGQRPAPGKRLANGAAVSLTVSRGKRR